MSRKRSGVWPKPERTGPLPVRPRHVLPPAGLWFVALAMAHTGGVKTWVCLLLAAAHASAALLTDRIDWGTAADNYEMVASALTVTSAGGVNVGVSQAGGAFFRLNQSDGWFGNFSPGEELLWTYYGGPIAFDFGVGGATAIQLRIAPDLYEAFSAELEVLDGAGASLARVSGAGQSTPMGDRSALLLSLGGVAFQQARVRLLTGSDLSSFAINAVEFNPGTLEVAANSQSAAVPEPATFGLAAVALAGVYWRSRRQGRG